MNTHEFLLRVWPTTGPYLLGVPASWTDKDTGKPRKGMRHRSFDTVDAAARAAQSIATDMDAPLDVYFALGALNEKRQTGQRKLDNIRELGAFWLDVDIKDKTGNYQTVDAAARSLKSFCKATGLPKPMIISSGGGLHVYWPLATALETEKWRHYARILKRLAEREGFLADPSRTADACSVLRPVGSYNWKTGAPREVRVLADCPPLDTDEFLRKLAFADQAGGNALGSAPQAPKVTARVNDLTQQALGGLVNEGPPSDPKVVVGKCQQLKWQATHPTEVEEPQWYDMIGCLRHCRNGEKAVHLVSRQYPGYDEDETNAKIAHHIEGDFGPTLCETFENHRPGGCDGCPAKGKVNSPITLGKRYQEAEAPVVWVSSENTDEQQVPLPAPQFPFMRVKHPTDGHTQIILRQLGDDGLPDEDTVVYEYDLYPSKLFYDERSREYRVAVERWLPQDGWAEFEFSLGKLYDRKNVSTTLGNIGIVPDLAKMDSVVQYMIGYIRDLQKSVKSAVVYGQLGWRENHDFVLPDWLISGGKKAAITPHRNVTNALDWNKHPPKGDLDTWKQVVSIYNREGMESFLFGFGVGFAAPLFHFTNFRGMIVSMVGEKGSGKSSAVLCANSIWGHSRMGWADLEHDTLKAFYNKLGVLQNLPATYDEITNLEPSLLSDLCYAVSKGQGRQRLDSSGQAQENFGGWQTMMITTSNSSLHARLSLVKADASAEATRVFEYGVPSGTITKQEADQTFDQLNDHYGLAGPIYAQALTERVGWIRERIKYWSGKVEAAAGIGSAERFWSAGPACVLTGFEIANEVELTQVNIETVYDFSVRAIKRMKTVVKESTRGTESIIADYINGNIRNMLVLATEPKATGPGLISLEPKNELRIRVEAWSNRMYIDRAHFRRFCAEQGTEAANVREELMQAGVLLNDNSRVCLGKDTSFKSGQQRCWLLDMNHPYLSGGLKQVVESSTEQQHREAV